MPGFLKDTFKKTVAFMRPRALLCLALAVAFCFSALLFSGQINTFKMYFGSESLTVRSLNASVDNALACAGISLDNYKIDSTVKNGDETVVSLLKTFTVFVTSGDKTVEVPAVENDTVKRVLDTAGYTVDEFDMIEPALDSTVLEDTYIDYINVDYVSGSYTQSVPHLVDTVYSDKLDYGKKTTTPGEDGIEQINFTQKIVNGEIVETSVDSRVTLLAAKNAVQTVGTRRPAVTTSAQVNAISVLTPATAIELDENGVPVNYTKHVTVQATAYTYTGHNCSTGVAPKPGYIAVNPKIIPYGTKMYIKSSDGKYTYGYAVAADTGGFIKTRPTNVDLFFPTVSSMNNFGRRNVEIYFLS